MVPIVALRNEATQDNFFSYATSKKYTIGALSLFCNYETNRSLNVLFFKKKRQSSGREGNLALNSGTGGEFFLIFPILLVLLGGKNQASVSYLYFPSSHSIGRFRLEKLCGWEKEIKLKEQIMVFLHPVFWPSI